MRPLDLTPATGVEPASRTHSQPELSSSSTAPGEFKAKYPGKQ
jgi:hypothetical protein